MKQRRDIAEGLRSETTKPWSAGPDQVRGGKTGFLGIDEPATLAVFTVLLSPSEKYRALLT